MRRLCRILLNAKTMLSLLLFVATVGMWVRSYYVADYFRWAGTNRNYFAYPRHGGIVFFGNWSGQPAMSLTGEYRRLTPGAVQSGDDSARVLSSMRFPGTQFKERSRGGFLYAERRFPSGQVMVAARLPFWPLAVVSATLPAVHFARYLRRRQRRRRLKGDRCPACGYDLRATPDRYPECGTIPAR